MLHFIEFHFQQDHKHSNTWMWNTCALLYIYSPIWFYNLLACALKGIYSVSYNATCVATPQKPWVIHVDAQLLKISFHPSFLWNQAHIHILLQKDMAYLPDYKLRLSSLFYM
jgi:hypothetical protein